VTPYVDLSYFLLLLCPLLALVVLGVLGLLRRPVVLGASVAIVLFQYGDPAGDVGSLRQLGFLVAYVAESVAIVLVFASIRRHDPRGRAFAAAVVLVLAPLVATKVYPVARGLLHASQASGGRGGGVGPPGTPSTALGFFDPVGFLGISYMALRVLDLLVVLRDGVVTETPRAADVVSYLLFVPTISAGPIDRFRHFMRALDALPRPRRAYLSDVEAGIHRIAQGLLYKFILANLLFRSALVPLAARAGILATIGYMYAFSLYLFFDFAGYSAFAIGVGRFFGIQVPENFNAPFVSRNFAEIWNRWHISLSWWLRDHVYMRFMLHAASRNWFAGNRRRAHHTALLLTMALMGCWHGLELPYVVYGLYQGLMLVAYDVAGRWSASRGLVADAPWARAGSVFLTVNLFCFGLLIFSGRLFPAAAR
jgi:membrane protein involved in D-alanine export